jgi:uncharacterized protein YukE
VCSMSVESYDTVKLVVSPQYLHATYTSVKSLVEEVAGQLEDINSTLGDLRLSWVGQSSALMQEISQQWQEAANNLFGTSSNPNQGAMNRLVEGLGAASQNYDGAENWAMDNFGQLAANLMSGGGGSSTPQSVTNTGGTTMPTTFIAEIF